MIFHPANNWISYGSSTMRFCKLLTLLAFAHLIDSVKKSYAIVFIDVAFWNFIVFAENAEFSQFAFNLRADSLIDRKSDSLHWNRKEFPHKESLEGNMCRISQRDCSRIRERFLWNSKDTQFIGKLSCEIQECDYVLISLCHLSIYNKTIIYVWHRNHFFNRKIEFLTLDASLSSTKKKVVEECNNMYLIKIIILSFATALRVFSLKFSNDSFQNQYACTWARIQLDKLH